MGSPPDILTMSTLSLLSLLTTVTISVAQSPSDDCWYGSVCPYNRDSPNQFLIDPVVEDTMLKKMTWCQAKCFNDQDCQHFTIHTARGDTTCYLLTSCMDPSDSDACIKDGLCNSGPKNCDTNNNCPMLADYVDPASGNKISGSVMVASTLTHNRFQRERLASLAVMPGSMTPMVNLPWLPPHVRKEPLTTIQTLFLALTSSVQKIL